jgi:hypothetical protein
MHEHSSTKTALNQEGCGISNQNFTGVFFPPHVRQRMSERGGDQQTIIARIARARQQHQQLRGDCALLGSNPVLIVEFRPKRAIVQSVLEPGMALKPGTPTVWA